MNRRTMAASVIGVVVATATGGYVAGSRITSPAEVASRTAAPEPSPILVPVEQRVLSTDVVTRGTGRFGSPQKLSVPASALKQNAGLIAELPLAGTELAEGDVAISASGRPVFLLAGARPMSRDLGPGLSGDDVRQLEESLSRLGFDVGQVDGVYDEGTAAGVSAWYADNGYAPFEATTEQLDAIRAREADLSAASLDKLAADDAAATTEAAIFTARSALTTSVNRRSATARNVERAQSEAAAAEQVAIAELAARQALADRLRSSQTVQRGSSSEVRVAQADLAAAEANASAVRTVGSESVALAQAAVDRAPARVSAAIRATAAADAAAIAEVASRQAAVDVLEGQPTVDEAQLAAATADLAAAVANAELVRTTGARTVTDEQQAATDAATALDATRAQTAAANAAANADVAAKQAALDVLIQPIVPTAAEIASADSDVAIATANRDVVRLSGERAVSEAIAAADDAAADVDVKQAELAAAETTSSNAVAIIDARTAAAELAALNADLARRRAGVQVPADEVVFVASAPVRVSDLLLGLGDAAIGGIMKVTDARVHVDAGLPVEEAGLITAGMTVQIAEPALGIATEGTVTVVAQGPGTNGVDGFHVYAEITVDSPPPNLVGASVRLTIPVGSTSGSVLAVPVSALTLAADGKSRVQRQVDGSPEFVSVEAGLSADGYVEVAAPDHSLHAGDLVVIGFELRGAASTAGPTATTVPPNG